MTSRQADRAILSWLLDLILLGMSLIVASWLRDRLPLGPNFAPAAHLPIFVFVLVGLIWSVLFVTMGIYRPMRLGRLLHAWRLVLLHLAAALLLAGLVYLIWREFSRYLFIYFVLLSLALLVTWRWLAWIVYARGRIHEPVRIAIVGTGPEALDIYTRIISSYDLKPELIGFISEENASGLPIFPSTGSGLAICRPFHS